MKVEGTRIEEKDKGVESERRGKSGEAHDVTSERSVDENRNGED